MVEEMRHQLVTVEWNHLCRSHHEVIAHRVMIGTYYLHRRVTIQLKNIKKIEVTFTFFFLLLLTNQYVNAQQHAVKKSASLSCCDQVASCWLAWYQSALTAQSTHQVYKRLRWIKLISWPWQLTACSLMTQKDLTDKNFTGYVISLRTMKVTTFIT